MSQPESEVKAFLAEHPKMIGVLFTTLLLLTQAGAAAGSAADITLGP